MKNQYFGDFGDYQKFSLLKYLRDIGNLSITVHWMKTKDDSSNDGAKIKYLSNPSEWDSFDPKIFGFLDKHIKLNQRDLSLYEKSFHAKDISFINDHVEDISIRNKLIQGIKTDKDSDIIFFDPDNGIEVKSTNVKNLHKYITWEDIKIAFDSGKSVLVYQHYSRMNRDKFIRGKLDGFNKLFKDAVFVIRAKHSVYFLLAQKKHASKISKSLKEYQNNWKELIKVFDPSASK
ncbi:MAG: hypothetical protein JWP09_792 [Candidatus Taylorbacteria bacterium]|nr:hypothetical protein [Candidatus Taylorbacteria bacterium]